MTEFQRALERRRRKTEHWRIKAERAERQRDALRAAIWQERRWATGTREHRAAQVVLYGLAGDEWDFKDAEKIKATLDA